MSLHGQYSPFVFLVAITFTHPNIHHTFFVVCLCSRQHTRNCVCASFFLPFHWPLHFDYFSTVTSAGLHRKLGLKCHVSHWSIDWPVTCFASLHMCVCARTPAHYIMHAFDNSHLNDSQFFLLHFMKLSSFCLGQSLCFSVCDGFSAGSWPLRWLTVSLVSRCSPPRSPPLSQHP